VFDKSWASGVIVPDRLYAIGGMLGRKRVCLCNGNDGDLDVFTLTSVSLAARAGDVYLAYSPSGLASNLTQKRG
jgi:hypothetical protein